MAMILQAFYISVDISKSPSEGPRTEWGTGAG